MTEDKNPIANGQDLTPVIQGQSKPPAAHRDSIPSKSKVIVLSFCVVILLLLVVADKIVNMNGKKGSKTGNPLDVENLDSITRRPLKIPSAEEVSNSDFVKNIQKLSESDDPIAHDILVKYAKTAESHTVRRMVETGLLNRARRTGLIRSSELVRQWLRKARGTNLPEAYQAVLKITNASLPKKDRFNLLEEVYRTEADFVLRYVAALAFDTGLLDHYQPILAKLVGDIQGRKDLSQYSFLGIILSYYPLARVFQDEIAQNREELTDGDILWILPILAERNDLNTRAVADLALKRGILSPQKQIYMKALRDKPGLSADIMGALIKAAGGIITPSDLGAFGKWIDPDSSIILLAIMADTTDRNLLVEAFDLLAGKSLTIEPAASLLQWVQDKYPLRRAEFAHLIGVLAFVEQMEPEDLNESFTAIDRLVQDPKVAERLIMTKNPFLIRMILDKYPGAVSIDTKILLLSHADKQIRIKVIYTINSNDIVVLKMTRDACLDEEDLEVKKHYKKHFEFLRESCY